MINVVRTTPSSHRSKTTCRLRPKLKIRTKRTRASTTKKATRRAMMTMMRRKKRSRMRKATASRLIRKNAKPKKRESQGNWKSSVTQALAMNGRLTSTAMGGRCGVKTASITTGIMRRIARLGLVASHTSATKCSMRISALCPPKPTHKNRVRWIGENLLPVLKLA